MMRGIPIVMTALLGQFVPALGALAESECAIQQVGTAPIRQLAGVDPVGEPGWIVGHVFGVVEGREVPLHGALVVLRRGDRVIREVHTNEEGGYVMREVAPGEYGMVARAEGFLPQGARVEVISEHETRQNFLLRPGDHRAGAIVGRVMEPSDGGPRPLAGALVTLHAGLHVIRQAVTNDDGRFEMPEVPPGVFALMAQAEHHHPGVRRVAVPPGEVVRAGFLLRPIREP